MAYMTNAQFKVLGKVWTEIRDNNGYVPEQVFLEFSELMQTIQSDKDRAKEKTRVALVEKRKDPIEAEKHRTYCREWARRKAEEKKLQQMKITKETKEIKVNTIFKDSDGYFIITDYDETFDCYIYSQCTKFGEITDKSIDNMYTAELEDFIGAKIIRDGGK